MKGIIFDIQKFALHDGPGIRTVVFLKGCPLKCVWCSNPESQRMEPQLGYLENKCTNCGKCIEVCPNQVFTLDEKLNVNFSACDTCGVCIEQCPTGALKMYGKEEVVATIMAEVKKDIPYYESSGGGLTLSGGEPMMQFEFALAILKEAKKLGVHTCMETSGYAPSEKFSVIADYVDLFLYDYKISDNFSHKRFTRVENELIIQNLDLLNKKGKDIILRCIVVPEINDNDGHFKAIVALENKYPNLKGIEIMPFHEYGKNKYQSIGKNQFKIQGGTASKEKAEEWLGQFRKLGSKKARIG